MKKFIAIVAYIWIAVPAVAQVNILVVYHSETGNTERMAEAVAAGAGSTEGANVKLLNVSEASETDVLNADAIIVGSPVYNANTAPEVQKFINSWPFEGAPMQDKIGAAFVTAGGISSGEEIVQMNILGSMLMFGMIIIGGPDWPQAFGASAITNEGPFHTGSPEEIQEIFLAKGTALGERVTQTVLKLKD